jgi:hypothetical protein
MEWNELTTLKTYIATFVTIVGKSNNITQIYCILSDLASLSLSKTFICNYIIQPFVSSFIFVDAYLNIYIYLSFFFLFCGTGV